MSVAVTLVHGTWGRKSAWTKESSKISEALCKGISDQVFLRRFEWSGGNSPSARSRAARELRQNLVRGITEYPHSKHFIIAHSHGGNVALYALRDSNLLASISGLVCLSTPFFNAQKRSLGPHVLDSFFLLAFLTIFGILSYVSVYWNISGKLFAGLMVTFCLLAFVLAFVLIAMWQSISERILGIFEIPSVPAQKILIVRMSADEASSAGYLSICWLVYRSFLVLSQQFIRKNQRVDGPSRKVCPSANLDIKSRQVRVRRRRFGGWFHRHTKRAWSNSVFREDTSDHNHCNSAPFHGARFGGFIQQHPYGNSAFDHCGTHFNRNLAVWAGACAEWFLCRDNRRAGSDGRLLSGT
jgi:hypothetical protein